jgi:polyisoprenyl-teichoic acid--peptidoglycan teichoic acid transferase
MVSSRYQAGIERATRRMVNVNSYCYGGFVSIGSSGMIDERDMPAMSGLQLLDEDWERQRRRGARRGVDGSHRDPSIDPTATSTSQLLASIVAPGAAALRRVPFVAVALLLFGVVLPCAIAAIVVLNRDEIIGLALDPTFLLAAIAIGGLAVVARFAAIAEVALAFRHSAGNAMRTAIAVAAVVVLASPVVWGVTQAAGARSAVSDVFASGGSDPLFDPANDGTLDPSTVTTPDGVTNILIFGGDAGPGRWGMRTDTMMLVTIDQASGRTGLISIPRNLMRLQFPPGTPLADEFPNGFDDLANAVFTHVNTNPELAAHYGSDGLQPEAVALSEALGYSLGVRVDDFALVNMQGFTEVIDAVGGVTLELGQSVPLPPSLPGERPLPPSIGPGLVDMDGALAIAYARSRSADSDYQRMGRQRQLLSALGSQVSTSEALRAFTTVTGVLDDSMRTSLSAGEFSDLLDRLGDNSAIRESVGLAPPLITPGSPDYTQIRSIVAAVQTAIVTDQPSGYAS